jgi:hypothetical protein
MHNANHSWLNDLRNTYPESFSGVRVLDIGSLDINGSCREYFTDCDYVGVDQTEGRGVDLVVPALKTKFKKKFDTLISFNCYEHDPQWKENVLHNLQWLKKGGKFFAEFGSTGCVPHFFPVFLEVPHDEFVKTLEEAGLTVLDHFWESSRYSSTQKGIYCVVAQK